MDNNQLIIKNGAELAAMAGENKLGDILKPLVREIHLFDSHVAGTSYLKDQTVLENLKDGDKLTLRRENNKFDSNAIMLCNEAGEKVGYVPEKDNVVFARLMDAGKLLVAYIKKIEKKGSFTKIDIGIHLVDF